MGIELISTRSLRENEGYPPDEGLRDSESLLRESRERARRESLLRDLRPWESDGNSSEEEERSFLFLQREAEVTNDRGRGRERSRSLLLLLDGVLRLECRSGERSRLIDGERDLRVGDGSGWNRVTRLSDISLSS